MKIHYDLTDVKIEKGIPKPMRQSVSHIYELLNEMEPGDSFGVPHEEGKGYSVAVKIRASVNYYNKLAQNTSKSFSVRSMKIGSEIRVWRDK